MLFLDFYSVEDKRESGKYRKDTAQVSGWLQKCHKPPEVTTKSIPGHFFLPFFL